MKKQPTHFIEVYKTSNTKIVTTYYFGIFFLPFIENLNKDSGCKTIAIFKIYPKK